MFCKSWYEKMQIHILLNRELETIWKESKIRIKLKSYDYNLIDKSAEKIVKTVKSAGAVVNGPIPLPTSKKDSSKSFFWKKKRRKDEKNRVLRRARRVRQVLRQFLPMRRRSNAKNAANTKKN